MFDGLAVMRAVNFTDLPIATPSLLCSCMSLRLKVSLCRYSEAGLTLLGRTGMLRPGAVHTERTWRYVRKRPYDSSRVAGTRRWVRHPSRLTSDVNAKNRTTATRPRVLPPTYEMSETPEPPLYITVCSRRVPVGSFGSLLLLGPNPHRVDSAQQLRSPHQSKIT